MPSVYKEDMSQDSPEEGKWVRVTLSFPEDMWQEVTDFRHANRISTASETVRRLVHEILAIKKAQKGRPG